MERDKPRVQATIGGLMNFNKSIGFILLAVYLILVGIVSLFSVAIPPIVIGILALAAGVLILIGR